MPKISGLHMPWKILALVVLTVITIEYSFALYQSLQAYERWKESYIQEVYASAGPLGHPRIVIDPYIITFEGVLAISFGIGLTVSWMVLARRCLNLRLERQKFEFD